MWPLYAVAKAGHAPGAQQTTWDNGPARGCGTPPDPGMQAPAAGPGARTPGARRTLLVRCRFKIKDHKDSTVGETRLANTSEDDLGRRLRRVGAHEPTVAHGTPPSFIPPLSPSPPGCFGRQITEEGESLTVVLTGT